jgi:L-ascorbate metabolism protein UlaG (beta-lactamase superfamily)
MRITWLGQSGYLLDNGETRVVIDPYFSDAVASQEGWRRLMPAPCSIASLRPDALCITHDHLDHFDPETVRQIMDAFPECQLLGPGSVRRHALALGVPESRMITLVAGAAATVKGFRVTATPARHSDPDAVGLLLGAADEQLWFSGDTSHFQELAPQVRQLGGRSPDLAFVCINGRWGNMDPHAATQLVSELQPRLAIPMHYGMFAENTAEPTAFCDTCATLGQRVAILEYGQTVMSEELQAWQA